MCYNPSSQTYINKDDPKIAVIYEITISTLVRTWEVNDNWKNKE